MSNHLPSTRTAKMPSLTVARIEEFHGRLVEDPGHRNRFSVPSDRALTTAERRALSAVAEQLEAELRPWTDPRPVDAIVSRILFGFEQGRGRGDDAEDVLVGEYLDAMKALPLKAIAAAADRFRSATTLLPWNRRWRPSPGEFAAEAREGMVDLRARLIRVRRVLDATVTPAPTQAQRDEADKLTAAHLKRIPLTDGPGQHRLESPREIQAARAAQLQGQVERLRRVGDGPEIGRLIQHLDARKAPPQGEGPQP